MEGNRLAETEGKFVELVWNNEPIPSGELVKLCEKELSWKKSTTYTVLRRLTEQGVLQNEDAVVTSKIKREEYYSMQSEQFVEDIFEGSLPQFIAAFMSRKKLSGNQIEEIQKLINEYHKEENR